MVSKRLVVGVISQVILLLLGFLLFFRSPAINEAINKPRRARESFLFTEVTPPLFQLVEVPYIDAGPQTENIKSSVVSSIGFTIEEHNRLIQTLVEGNKFSKDQFSNIRVRLKPYNNSTWDSPEVKEWTERGESTFDKVPRQMDFYELYDPTVLEQPDLHNTFYKWPQSALKVRAIYGQCASILFVNWSKKLFSYTQLPLDSLLLLADGFVMNHIVLIFPETEVTRYEHDSIIKNSGNKLYNSSLKYDENNFKADMSLEELQIFEFVGEKRRWDVEIPQWINMTNNWHFPIINKISSDHRHLNSKFYVLKGFHPFTNESQMMRDFDETQYWNNCEDTSFVVHLHWQCGMGCMIHWAQAYLNYCNDRNQTIAMVPHDYSFFGQGCPSFRDHRCFFLQYPGCHFDQEIFYKERDAKNMTTYPNATQMGPVSVGIPTHRRWDWINTPHLMWFRGVAQYYTQRMNPTLYNQIWDAVAELEHSFGGEIHPCLSIHIRRGDKVAGISKENEATADDIYVNALLDHADFRERNDMIPLNKVFLMTDDDSLTKTFHLDKRIKDKFKFAYMNIDRTSITHINNGYHQGVEVLQDIYMASRCVS